MHSFEKIGVVTVTYNSATVIRDFMESLLKQSYQEFLLYVVDNCSSDNTLSLLAEYPNPRVIVIRSSINVGVAEGNNIGIRAALNDGCASVMLINNDTAFGPDLLSQLRAGLGTFQCDMIVPKILYFDEPQKIWSAGGAFSVLRGRSKHLGFNQKDDGRFDRAQQVEYSPTCCMLIKCEVFDRVGMMDAHYFVYFDDADFCFRVHRAGLRLFYLPTARLLHKVSSLIGHRSDISIRFVTRNHVYFVLKHFRIALNLYYLPICQAHILVRCWFTKNRTKAFLIAQKAFWEGVALFCSTRNAADITAPSRAPFPSARQSARSARRQQA